MASLAASGILSTALVSGSTELGIASLAGTAISSLGSMAAGRQQQASANYNAQVAANNAQIATQNANLVSSEGAANAAIESQKTRAQVGGIKAAQAANNIDVNQGSAVDVRSSAAELGELNAITIRSNASRQAYGFQTQEASDTAQSQLDKQQGKYAAEAGDINAGSTLLSGVANAGKNWGGFLNNSPSTMPILPS